MAGALVQPRLSRRLGFTRNLEAWEMVEQVLTIRRESPERPVTGVVFQGQGEPFQNYDNVIRAAEILRAGRARKPAEMVRTEGLLVAVVRRDDTLRLAASRRIRVQ
jgi:23S rRNA (adenine2503-C2)-methyltransferase